MDKRPDTSKSGYREDVGSHPKKSKKRSSKRNSMLNSWMNSIQTTQNNDIVPDMDHQHVLWQSNVQQSFPSNGQRLFTTASDPSMCGYAQMPMTYAMEPVSLPPMYRLYQPVPFSGIRAVPSRPRRHCNQNHPMNLSVNSMGNGYTSLQENGMASPIPVTYQNGDYASLPPTANRNNGINGDELNSEHRRYSDPGLGSAEAPLQSEDPDSADSGSSITTIGRSNKLVLSLIEQMTELKKSNSQLFKELNETKSELGSMKAKLAQCKYNGSADYQPGMLSDFIREIRQANKTCEEGLVSKVKAIVEEKLNQRSLEVANLNNQILKLIEEKEESEKRISKLEEEVATLRLNANNEGREIAAFEEETLALRRELQEARASKNLAENHVAKLEKLLDILRNKMIGTKDQETGDAVGTIKVKRVRNPSTSSSEEDLDEEEEEDEEKQREGEEDDGNVDYDDDKGTPYEKVADRSSLIENCIKLSGPVTDL